MADKDQNPDTATISPDSCSRQFQTVDGKPVTHCHNCWYDLTGLPSNRCPECGTEITGDKIKELSGDYGLALEPINWKQVAKRLLVVPLAIWLAFLVLGLLIASALELVVMVFFIVLLMGLAGGFFIAMGFSFVVADQFAARLCYRTGRPLTSTYHSLVMAMLSLVLLAFQVVVSIMPILALIWVVAY